MSAEPCPICQTPSSRVLIHRVLSRFNANLHLCSNCDYLFVAQPDWLAQAYERVINPMDTGCLARTELMREATALILYLIAGGGGRWLDYGGGHGAFVRRMRDTGFDFNWFDPMAKNLFAVGFEETGGETFDGLTCWECLEHFTDPRAEVEKMLSRGPRILFSTELRPAPVPPPDQWWYYGWDHGQHVGFHSLSSLAVLAEGLGLRLVSSGKSLHAFLPPGEEDSAAARLIRRGSLPLFSWLRPSLRGLWSARALGRSLLHRRILSKDLVSVLERRLGSRIWADLEQMRSRSTTPSQP